MDEKPKKRQVWYWLTLATVLILVPAWALIVTMASGTVVRWSRPLEPPPVAPVVRPSVSAPSGAENVDIVTAKAGVGKQGRYQERGLVITSIRAYFRTQQRTELEIKIPHAINLYRAEHGHFPKTPQDFERDIVELNQIKLPELPMGHRYVYDAEKGLLQVERPEE